METESNQLEFGGQPLDRLLDRHQLCNHDLVAAATEPLTHKQVAKGRKGRRLTHRIQKRIVAALNKALVGNDIAELELSQVFTYRGR